MITLIPKLYDYSKRPENWEEVMIHVFEGMYKLPTFQIGNKPVDTDSVIHTPVRGPDSRAKYEAFKLHTIEIIRHSVNGVVHILTPTVFREDLEWGAFVTRIAILTNASNS